MHTEIAYAQLFLALLDEPTRQQIEQIPDHVELLGSLYPAAASAWPGIELPADVFLRYLAARVPTSASLSLERALRNWRAADLYLCCACVEGVAGAAEAFNQQHAPVIAAILRDLRLGPALPQDLQQQVLDQLLVATSSRPPQITNYAGIGRLSRWLRVVTGRIARRALSREKKLVLVGDEALATRLVDARSADELSSLKRTYQQHFKAAFKQALAELAPADAMLLRYRFIDELSLEKIGEISRVHHSTILRRLDKLRLALLKNTRAVLQQRLGADFFECQSIIRLVQSDIDLTLQTFLSVEPPDRAD